jgi:hypothetical protein
VDEATSQSCLMTMLYRSLRQQQFSDASTMMPAAALFLQEKECSFQLA